MIAYPNFNQNHNHNHNHTNTNRVSGETHRRQGFERQKMSGKRKKVWGSLLLIPPWSDTHTLTFQLPATGPKKTGPGKGYLTDAWPIELELQNKAELEAVGKENLKIPTGGRAGLTLSNNDKVVEPHNTRNTIAKNLNMSTGKEKNQWLITAHIM